MPEIWGSRNREYHVELGWSRGTALDLFPGSVRFDPRPGHELSSLRFFMVFLSPSRQMQRQYLDKAIVVSFQILSNSSSFSYHLTLYTLDTEEQSLNNPCEKGHFKHSEFNESGFTDKQAT
jgi:hypothetical protein